MKEQGGIKSKILIIY